jgi:hypothetical protein
MSLTSSSSDYKSFQHWQPEYAAHGIATIPVHPDKVPMVKRAGLFGLPGSADIARKYPDALGFGFMAGPRSRITVLDIDTPSETVLADALNRYGQTSIIVRSGSGNHHAWYRHNGERRHVRAEAKIDILGGGLVVAPPSQMAKGGYQFIQGQLDDLDRLPVMANVPEKARPLSKILGVNGAVSQGERNDRLFRLCLVNARSCDDLDALIDVAMTRNAEFLPPLDDPEVMRTAASAWRYQTEGRNYSGGCCAVFREADLKPLMADPYVGILLLWARARFKPDAMFWIADGLAAEFGWTLYDLRQARNRAVEMGVFRLVRRARFKNPAVYAYGPNATGNRDFFPGNEGF